MPLGLSVKRLDLEAYQASLKAQIYEPSMDSMECPEPTDQNPALDSLDPSNQVHHNIEDLPDTNCAEVVATLDPDVKEIYKQGDVAAPPKTRQLHPDNTAHKLYARWKKVLPQLLEPLLSYMSASMGREHYVPGEPSATCKNPGKCKQRSSKMLCLFFSCKE